MVRGTLSVYGLIRDDCPKRFIKSITLLTHAIHTSREGPFPACIHPALDFVSNLNLEESSRILEI